MDFLHFREPASAWTHALGLMVAAPAAWLLWLRSDPADRGKRISVGVYGLSLILCYSASTLYHGVRLPDDRLGPFVGLDSVGIFALIAGTYTPIAWYLLRGPWRTWTLAAVWVPAIASTILIASGRAFSPTLGTGIYLAMGWIVLACYGRIARAVSHRAMIPLVVGGVLYSVGAVLNRLRWPALAPGTFGTHDLFHLFVIGGSVCHYLFIWRVVAAKPPGSAEGSGPS